MAVHLRVLRLLLAGAATGVAVFGPDLRAQTILVPTNAVWKYLDNGTDQGTVWRTPGFIDGAWQEGPAELGFGDAVEGRPEATMLDPGPPSPNHYITYYFRHRFSITGVASVTNLVAQVMRDDGAVVYLNGTEAGRTGMNPGPVDFLTPAAQPGASGDAEFTFFSLNVDPGLLVEGENVLAVEVHQLSGMSSDVSFALKLLVITNAPPPSDKGQTLIVPPSVANVTAGYGSGTLSAPNLRIQEVYGSANFPPDTAMWITELCYRPDLVFGNAFNTTVNDIQINLSTTSRNPDALSFTYAQNVGPDDTVVFDGVLQISSQFTGLPGGPRDFDIRIPLTAPFLYDPGAGNLLVDIRNSSGSGASLLSGQRVTGDSASRTAGGLGSSTGVLDSGVDALQIVFTLTNPPSPLLLLRGPYLQRGTTTNLLVCWRTSRPTNAIVRFGLADNTLVWEARSQVLTNNQCVELTNLAPNTKYYYSVGANDTNLARGAEFYFTTAPVSAKPTRIWALGDCGTASQPFQTGALLVRDAYLAYTGSRETDVWLMLGDNAYGYGKDSEYQAAVFDVFQAGLRRWPLWSTIGNHETYAPIHPTEPEPVAYWDIFRLPMQGEAGGVPSGTERYYSFNYANIHFVCLDSEISYTNNGGVDMLQWLQADLDDNTNEWIIAFWHSPPYTKGSHNSDSFADSDGRLFWMREQVCPLLERNGVDLVLCGHSHCYERSYLMHGHYGTSLELMPSMIVDGTSGRPEETGPYQKPDTGPQAGFGTVYVVAGSSGQATFLQFDGPHPAMFITRLNLGSTVIDVDGPRLDARFLRETGAIDDSFTITKGSMQAPLLIATIRVVNGMVTARFDSQTGRHYQIERTPQLEHPVWSATSDVFEATSRLTIWSAPAPEGAERSFYRVVRTD
ncbi:MAG TPA: metallophosphoesterase family protein [Verrucomicrobiae bacterium]|nr:metallophosphoesterase family protein [Verrucomicrobiae bacterium]